MKRSLVLLVACLLHTSATFCQQTLLKPFSVEGTINVDTGQIELFMIGDSSLYPKSTRHLNARITKGKFAFQSKIPHPMGFMLKMGDRYLSEVIVLDFGKQTIECNIDSSYKFPVINNQIMKDYADYNQTFKDIRRKRKLHDESYSDLKIKYPEGIPEAKEAVLRIELQSLYDESDRTLLKYIVEHPGSYLALWRFINLTNFGYEKIFDEIMPHFSDSIKNSFSGRILANNLKKAAILSVGNKFPKMVLLDIKGKQSTGILIKNNEYTLVDFWYTHCSPCIAQFPSFVATYNIYHSKGFEIAGISTDALKYGKGIPAFIKKHKIKWPQYWDVNGKGAEELSILAFPTNFLLDAKGYIIQKNISPPELAVFLSKNL